MMRKIPIHYACLFSVLTAACTLTGCSEGITNQLKVQNDLSEAVREAEIGNTKEARNWADKAIAVDPKALRTYVRIGADQEKDDFMNLGDVSIADVFLATVDDQTAADYMHQAIEKFPTAYEPLEVLEQIQTLTGDDAGKRATATALAALIEKKFTTPGAKTDDKMVDALAQAYWNAGDPAKGELNYRRAIGAYPGQWRAYNDLASQFADANVQPKLSEALDLANKALGMAQKEVDSDKKDAPGPEEISLIQDTIGWVYYRRGDNKQALNALLDAVNGAPRQPEIRYHIAMVYLALNDPISAKAEFIHATLLNKNYVAPQQELAKLKPKDEAPPASKPTA